LSGVLMSFSYLDLYGLEKVGVIVTDEEKKAYMHLWNVFGYVLGVEEDALLRLDFPRTGAAVYKDGKAVHDASGEEMVATGRAIYTRVLQLNRATDAQGMNDGRILTKAINDYLADLLKRRLPWAKFLRVDRLPYLMMAMMLSKDDRGLLNVKPNLIDRMVFPIVLFVLRIRGIVAKTVGLPASAFANLIFHYMEDENNTVYEELEKQTGVRYPGIPAEFQEQWGTVKK
jgi:ER-bound oxygenase mpaB/B'/Rubber oxygenase, catalytic domain